MLGGERSVLNSEVGSRKSEVEREKKGNSRSEFYKVLTSDILHLTYEMRSLSPATLPFKKGQTVEMTLKPIKEKQDAKPVLTAQKLLRSGLPGIWADRKDIGDSSVYARRLREQAQKRKRL